MRAAWLAVVVLCVACASPTLPLPPPQTPSVTEVSMGKVTLRSDRGAQPHAIIVIVNQEERVPVAERANAVEADDLGSWEKTITAGSGDVIDITQEFDTGDKSPPITIRIR